MDRADHSQAPDRSARVALTRAAIAAFALVASSAPVLADNHAGCLAGYQRYNQHIEAYNFALARCISDGTGDDEADRACAERLAQCSNIAPEVGYANCEAFIRSGYGTPAQREWAGQVADRLASLYRRCQAQ